MKTKTILFSLIFIFLISFISADNLVIENFSDYGEDWDDNGIYDSLVINVAMDLSGNYTRFRAVLKDENQEFIDFLSYRLYNYSGEGNLEGYNEFPVQVDGRDLYMYGVDGPYTLTDMRVCGSFGCEYFEEEYETANYSYTDFEMPEIIFMEVVGEETPDEDGNDLYDSLNLDVLLNVTKEGYYNLRADLESLEEYSEFDVAESNLDLYLEQGVQTITLEFPGYSISANQINGPYLFDYFRYENEFEDSDYRYYPNYTTQYYNYSYFEEPLVQIVSDFEEEAVDINNNSLYDSLHFSFDINISDEEPIEDIHLHFGVVGQDEFLYNEFVEGEIVFNENTVGIQTVDLYVPGLEIRNKQLNGPYDLLGGIEIELTSGEYIEWIFSHIYSEDNYTALYTTENYTYEEFEVTGATITPGTITEHLEEITGDQFYDLVISIPVNVTHSNYYWLEVETDFLEEDDYFLYLEPGIQELIVFIDGALLFENQINGVYEIEEIELNQFFGGDFDDDFYQEIGSWDDIYETEDYSYSEFEVLIGDVTNDAQLDVGDVIRLVDVILAIGDSPTEFELFAGDLNEDGTLNIQDVVMLVEMILDIGREEVRVSEEPVEINLEEYHSNLESNQVDDYNWNIKDIEGPIRARIGNDVLKIYATKSGEGFIKLELVAEYNNMVVGKRIVEFEVKSNLKQEAKPVEVKVEETRTQEVKQETESIVVSKNKTTLVIKSKI